MLLKVEPQYLNLCTFVSLFSDGQRQLLFSEILQCCLHGFEHTLLHFKQVFVNITTTLTGNSKKTKKTKHLWCDFQTNEFKRSQNSCHLSSTRTFQLLQISSDCKRNNISNFPTWFLLLEFPLMEPLGLFTVSRTQSQAHRSPKRQLYLYTADSVCSVIGETCSR